MEVFEKERMKLKQYPDFRNIKRTIITMDAMGTQTAIAKKIPQVIR